MKSKSKTIGLRHLNQNQSGDGKKKSFKYCLKKEASSVHYLLLIQPGCPRVLNNQETKYTNVMK